MALLLVALGSPAVQADTVSSPAVLKAASGRLAIGFASFNTPQGGNGAETRWVQALVVEPGDLRTAPQRYANVDLSQPWAMIVAGLRDIERGTSRIECEHLMNVPRAGAKERPHAVLPCGDKRFEIAFGHAAHPVGAPYDLGGYHDRVEKESFPYSAYKGYTLQTAPWLDVGTPVPASHHVEYVAAGRGPSLPYMTVCETILSHDYEYCYGGNGSLYKAAYVGVFDSLTELSLVITPGAGRRGSTPWPLG